MAFATYPFLLVICVSNQKGYFFTKKLLVLDRVHVKRSKRMYGLYTLKAPEKTNITTEFYLKSGKEFSSSDRSRLCYPLGPKGDCSEDYMTCDDFK